MSEYIFEIDTPAGFNEKTGEIVLAPKYVGEIIRCEDCKYFDKKSIFYDFDGTKLYRCNRNKYWFLPNDFCSKSKRKDIR